MKIKITWDNGENDTITILSDHEFVKKIQLSLSDSFSKILKIGTHGNVFFDLKHARKVEFIE